MKKAKKQQSENSNLHPKFFWDTDIDKLDWQKPIFAVIARIIERGGLRHEIDEIVYFYGYKKVIRRFVMRYISTGIMLIDDAFEVLS